MMELTFAPRGILQVDHARLVFKNFKGEEGKFNRAGERNFALVIESQEQLDALLGDVSKNGDPWNVKVKDPREEGDLPFMYLPVKVKFNDHGPQVYLISGNAKTRLTEASVAILDDVEILDVCLDIRPYDGEVNGKTYRTAYLKSIQVIQEVDRFADFEVDELVVEDEVFEEEI